MKGNTYIPSERVADYVDSILVIENDGVSKPFSLPLFANGKPTLLFQTTKGKLKGSANYLTLFGQTVLPEKITLTENFTMIAYFFKPFALTSLFGFTASELTDNPINLNLINQQAARDLEDKLLNAVSTSNMIGILEDYIYALTTKIITDTKLIQYATTLIAAKPTKEVLVKTQSELYLTERTFQRMFEQKVGVSPNQYRRIAQFNAAFQQLNQRQFKLFLDIALENDYADQSHFIRAFKEFTHLTPKEYMAFSRGDQK